MCPYRGTGPSLNDVVAGTISGAYTTTISAEGLIKSGQVKVLGVAGPKRSEVVPDVPTFAEQGVATADANVWIGLLVPAKTPKAIIDKINRDANQALRTPEVRSRFAQWGLEVEGGSTGSVRFRYSGGSRTHQPAHQGQGLAESSSRRDTHPCLEILGTGNDLDQAALAAARHEIDRREGRRHPAARRRNSVRRRVIGRMAAPSAFRRS